MTGEKERVDVYARTIERLEPDIAAIDAAAGWASIAISLKRIAAALESIERNVRADPPRGARRQR